MIGGFARPSRGSHSFRRSIRRRWDGKARLVSRRLRSLALRSQRQRRTNGVGRWTDRRRLDATYRAARSSLRSSRMSAATQPLRSATRLQTWARGWATCASSLGFRPRCRSGCRADAEGPESVRQAASTRIRKDRSSCAAGNSTHGMTGPGQVGEQLDPFVLRVGQTWRPTSAAVDAAACPRPDGFAPGVRRAGGWGRNRGGARLRTRAGPVQPGSGDRERGSRSESVQAVEQVGCVGHRGASGHRDEFRLDQSGAPMCDRGSHARRSAVARNGEITKAGNRKPYWFPRGRRTRCGLDVRLNVVGRNRSRRWHVVVVAAVFGHT